MCVYLFIICIFKFTYVCLYLHHYAQYLLKKRGLRHNPKPGHPNTCPRADCGWLSRVGKVRSGDLQPLGPKGPRYC